MKKSLCLTIIGFMVTNLVCAGSDTFELLSKTESALPERARCPVAIVERRNQSLLKIESFDLLQSDFRSTWREDMASLDTVAPTDTAKAIFFKASQNLPRKDYAEFLLATVDLAAKGKISKQQFHWAFRPFTKHLIGIWDDVPNKTLREVAERSKVVYADDPVMLNFCHNILTGETAAKAKVFNERYYGPPTKPRPTLHPSRNDLEASKSFSESGRWKWSVPLLWCSIIATCMVTLVILFRRFR